MRTTRLAMTTVLAAGLVGVGAPALASGLDDLYDCADFDSQEQAQATFDASDDSDPNRLDADDDGVACEDLPSNGGQPVESLPLDDIPEDADDSSSPGDDSQMAMPSGGADTGAGGSAGDVTGLLATGGLLAAVGAGGLVVLRRRVQA